MRERRTSEASNTSHTSHSSATHSKSEERLKSRIYKLLRVGYKEKEVCKILNITPSRLEEIIHPKRASKRREQELAKGAQRFTNRYNVEIDGASFDQQEDEYVELDAATIQRLNFVPSATSSMVSLPTLSQATIPSDSPRRAFPNSRELHYADVHVGCSWPNPVKSLSRMISSLIN
ncbi:hypothetical protein J8273_8144 [Carpediemonas membranifera]|uniref:Uncharacterized protein n=1 Tax=Carpediemonas membranifera TaxID=201153 RepID=A0A8J6B040_9EUKA|nr:hypothetical protein J8273_8144 [Carpediemonas membranifera]|eukprot:KAG9390107.1 hypothetical protein J8273_8144 [Carpediemonas membranifera]